MMDQRVGASDAVADRVRRHAVDLLRFDASLRRRVLRLLRDAESNLVRRLIDGEVEGTLSAVAQARLEAVLAQVRSTTATAYRRIDQEVSEQLADLAQVETVFAQKSLNMAVGIALETAAFTPQQLRSIAGNALIEGAPSQEWWSRQAGDLVERFADQVRQGMVNGETNVEIVRRVRGRRANNYQDGIMAVTRKNAESLVRSSVQAVANDAQIATYQANSDVVESLVTLVTLDGRTSQTCIGRSGLEYTLDGKPIGHRVPFNGGPPYHFNCRTVMSPRMKSWRSLGFDIDELPPSTRASMDGQVPADISFDEWLKGKSDTFQNDLLGAGKAGLWREDKITLRDLIDQTGRPLSLEQLKARI